MPEQVALDGIIGIAKEMDRRHFGIDLELPEGGEKKVLGRNRIGCRERIAQQQPFPGGDHDIDDVPAEMHHDLVVSVERGGRLEHPAQQLRTAIVSGIKKNCLIARQFQTFYRIGFLEDDNA